MVLCLTSDSRLLLVGASSLLSSRKDGDVDEAPVVLDSLLGTSGSQLLLFLLLNLGGLVLDLTGTSKGAVHFSSTSQTQHQMKGRFLLDIVIRQSSAILQLLSGKDQSLLIRGNAFLVLDLLLDVVNGVRSFHFKGDGLASKGLNKNLNITKKNN